MILDPYVSPSYSLILCFSNLAGATAHCLPFPKVPKCWGHHLTLRMQMRLPGVPSPTGSHGKLVPVY